MIITFVVVGDKMRTTFYLQMSSKRGQAWTCD